MSMCVCVHMCVHVCERVYTCVHVCACVCTCVCACVHVCTCVCVHVCVFMCVHMSPFFGFPAGSVWVLEGQCHQPGSQETEVPTSGLPCPVEMSSMHLQGTCPG